jgi:hypothetical protein
MAVFSFPDDPAFDSETRAAVDLAYTKAIKVLGLNERTGLATEFVTAMIMSVAYSGVRDPDRLCDYVVREMKGRSYLTSPPARRQARTEKKKVLQTTSGRSAA